MLNLWSTTPIFGQSEGSKSAALPKIESRPTCRGCKRDGFEAFFDPNPQLWTLVTFDPLFCPKEKKKGTCSLKPAKYTYSNISMELSGTQCLNRVFVKDVPFQDSYLFFLRSITRLFYSRYTFWGVRKILLRMNIFFGDPGSVPTHMGRSASVPM